MNGTHGQGRGRRSAGAAVVMLATLGAQAQFLEPDVTVIRTHRAEAAGDSFGWVGEAIGDLDQDGASEYVIGAPFNNEGGPAAGKAYVYSGATGGLLATHIGAPNNWLGFGVSGVGDVDADGTPDYVLGGPGLPGDGRVLVISGADHTVLHDVAGNSGSQFGYDVNRAGDVDGDGASEVVVGAVADNGTGSVTLLSGRTGAEIWSTNGLVPGDMFGSAVTGTGDLDGDTVADVAIGAYGAGGNGRAYLLSGVTGALVGNVGPVASGGTFGWFFVHDAGDVNADGVPDLYVGDFSDNVNNGRGYVFSGRNAATLFNFAPDGFASGLGMGRGAGDVNGDGHADLLLGAYTNSTGIIQGGRVYLRSGRNGLVMRTFTGTEIFKQIGFDVVAPGDLNADGLSDYVLTGVDVVQVVAGTAVDDDPLRTDIR